VAANDSPENRALNRRVDIKILYDQPSEEMPADAGDGEIEPSEKGP
jgi:hypothetical protein